MFVVISVKNRRTISVLWASGELYLMGANSVSVPSLVQKKKLVTEPLDSVTVNQDIQGISVIFAQKDI